MRDRRNAFHLAIPVNDLEDAMHFYVDQLGCHLARRYPDRITLDFFGDQVVCHLSPSPETETAAGAAGIELDLYPRHFGVTFRRQRDFEALLALAECRKMPFFRKAQTRFAGMVEAHQTFVLRDPSDNLLEFKHYVDPRMMH